MNCELKRKAFHLLSLAYPIAYLFLERRTFLIFLSIILALIAALEFMRLRFPHINKKLVGLLGNIHRSQEMTCASGIFWTALGTLVTVILFTNKAVVLCTLGYLIFSDTASALAGTWYGRHKYLNKSLEGSAAFLGTSLAIGLFFFSPAIALAGAMFSTLVESLPLPFNDNFWIPPLSACFLSIITGNFIC